LGERLSGTVRFVDDHKVRTMDKEICTVSFGLGVVYAYDDMGKIAKNALVLGREFSLELTDRAGADDSGFDMEFFP
jgi:hypothetical protein